MFNNAFSKILPLMR